MSEIEFPNRQILSHDVPHWVEEGSVFFITVNCAERGLDQLTQPKIAAGLLEAARFYQERHLWHIQLILLMPDHFHALMSFPRDSVMADLFKSWKRYTARRLGIAWQDGFFDHRLRNENEVTEKHFYIRQNPVRKGLCEKPDDWPHQMHWANGRLIVGVENRGATQR
jgi:putative transposase